MFPNNDSSITSNNSTAPDIISRPRAGTFDSSITSNNSTTPDIISRPRAGTFDDKESHNTESGKNLFVRSHRTQHLAYSPVVLAMLSGNHMRDCKDATEMYKECLASGSKDRICDTAATYFKSCIHTDQ